MLVLTTGSRLGPYEIHALIGQGGMGEVYRATDTRLKRDVALKVLPSTFASDPDRLARFEREAQVLASLNHPHVAGIYGIEESNGTRALVMELVEGPTLADRIAQGPIPLDEALPIARQIAEALEAAHEAGIIHRDLKPANIKLRPDGTVKVLDFGLAKALEPAAPAAALANSPTFTSPAMMTHAGVVLGTAAYMSPEQARGKTVDKRTDIWAFGAVFYEMLTARPAFDGATSTDIIAAVLRSGPDWSRLSANVPMHVRRLLERCLRPDPTQRLRDIGDVRLELTDPPLSVQSPPRGESRRWWVLAGAVVAAIGTLAAAWTWLPWRSGDTAASTIPPLTFSVIPPPGMRLSPEGSGNSAPIISPDGRAVVFAATGGYFLRRFENLAAIPLPALFRSTPFWSPDSASIAFWSDHPTPGLYKMRLPSGAPQLVAALPKHLEITSARGGSWSAGNVLLQSLQPSSAGPSEGTLLTVPSDGGEAKLLTIPDLKGRYYGPHFLPNSNDFLFLLDRQDGTEREIYLATLRDGAIVDPVRLRANETPARFTPAAGGRLVFVQNDNLYAQRLNVQARRLEGDPELVVSGVTSQPGLTMPYGDFSVAHSGSVAWRPGTAVLSQVTMFDRTGKQVGLIGPPSPIESIFLSPNDKRLLLATASGGWIIDVDQPGRRQIPGGVQWTGWSPDSSNLVGVTASHQLIERSPDGAGQPRVVAEMITNRWFAWFLHAPDLSRVFAVRQDGAGIWGARTSGSEDDRTFKPLIETGERLFHARLSPDARWIVYGAAELDYNNLFVQPVSGRTEERRRIAANGVQPAWRGDGKEILYVNNGVWSVPVDTDGGELRFGPPQELFSANLRPPAALLILRLLAVSHDGSRIFFPQRIEQTESNVIHVSTQLLHAR